MFHDPVIVTAILDRLLHHSVVINIRGNSYRFRGKTTNEALEGAKYAVKWLSFHDRKWLTFRRPLTQICLDLDGIYKKLFEVEEVYVD